MRSSSPTDGGSSPPSGRPWMRPTCVSSASATCSISASLRPRRSCSRRSMTNHASSGFWCNQSCTMCRWRTSPRAAVRHLHRDRAQGRWTSPQPTAASACTGHVRSARSLPDHVDIARRCWCRDRATAAPWPPDPWMNRSSIMQPAATRHRSVRVGASAAARPPKRSGRPPASITPHAPPDDTSSRLDR